MEPPPPRLFPSSGGGGGMRRAPGDAGVQSTNDDAQISKLSCVERGYFADGFVRHFVRRPQRRGPLINRGYWARYAAMRRALLGFLRAYAGSSGSDSGGGDGSNTQAAAAAAAALGQGGDGGGPRCQVAVLGAGADTAWFALAAGPAGGGGGGGADNTPKDAAAPAAAPAATAQPYAPPWPTAGLFAGGPRLGAGAAAQPRTPPPELAAVTAGAAALLARCRYIEVDFPEVAARKARTILSRPAMWQALPPGTVAVAPASSSGGGGGGNGGGAGCDGACRGGSSSGGGGEVAHAWVRGADGTGGGCGNGSSSGGGGGGGGDAEMADAAPAPSSSSSPPPPPHVAQHAREIRGPGGLGSGSGGGSGSSTTTSTSSYCLVGADLRRLGDVDAAVARAGFDPRLPTLFIAECVLVYLEAHDAAALLRWAAAAPAPGVPVAVAVYEMARPGDAFGRTMVANLEERGCPLLSLPAVPLPSDQTARLLAAGWARAAAADMCSVYYGGWLRPPGARRAAERLEPLDELEEYRLMQGHYVLALGARGGGGTEGDGGGGTGADAAAAAVGLPELAALGDRGGDAAGGGSGGGTCAD